MTLDSDELFRGAITALRHATALLKAGQIDDAIEMIEYALHDIIVIPNAGSKRKAKKAG